MGTSTKWVQGLALKVVFIASNVIFFVISSWILSTGSNMRKAGWFDVVEDDYPWFHPLYVIVVISLSFIIGGMALSGLYTMLCKRKPWVLLTYAGCSFLAMVLFLSLTITASLTWSASYSWSTRSTIDRAIEGDMETNFNQIYCHGEATYLCTASATNAQWLVHYGSDDLRDLFLNPDIANKIKQALATERSRTGLGRNFLELCEDETSILHFPMMDHQMANMCTWCGQVALFKSYLSIVRWANTKCPPDTPSALYCAQTIWPWMTTTDVPINGFIKSIANPSAVSVDMAPYRHCRKTFLSYWSYFALWFLVLSCIMLVYMFVVMRIAWLVLRPPVERSTERNPERRPLVPVLSKTRR